MMRAVLDKMGRQGKAVTTAVSEGLSPMRIEGDDLHERAVAYVVDGSSPELVLELQARDTSDLQEALAHPGFFGWTYFSDSVSKRVKKVTSGLSGDDVARLRGTLYDRQDVTGEQLSRMGRLLAAVVSDVGPIMAVPEWFEVLARDVALSRVAGRRRSGAVWQAARYEEVARAGGLAEDEAAGAVVQALFARPRERYYGHRFDLGAVLNAPETVAYFASRARVVAAEVPRLGAEGKKAFIRFAVANDLPEPLQEVLAGLTGDTAKGVRQAADQALADLPDEVRVRLQIPLLDSAPTNTLGDVVTRIIGATGGLAATEAVLEKRAASGAKPDARTSILAKAVERARTLALVDEEQFEVPPFEPLADAPLGASVHEAAVARHTKQLAAARDRLTEVTKEVKHPDVSKNERKWRMRRAEDEVKRLAEVRPAELTRLFDIVAGVLVTDPEAEKPPIRRTAVWFNQNLTYLAPNATAMQVLRLVRFAYATSHRIWGHLRGHLDGITDLRVLRDAFERVGCEDPDEMVADLVFHRWAGIADFPPDQMWMYFADRIDVLDAYLMPRSEYEYGHAASRVLEILGHFPALPPALLPALSRLAMGSAKSHRAEAQAVLARHPQARALAEHGLTDGTSAVRISAAGWLANLGDAAALPALRTALSKERREDVRAAFLAALETLGEDIAEHLSVAKLAAEAAKGLKKKNPVSMSWFPLATLPDLRWQDGTAVPREIAQWWVVLAVRLKDPSGAGLLARYVSLLDETSRATLGSYMVRAWVAQDTRGPSVAESRKYATSVAQNRYDWAQGAVKRHPEVEWYRESAAVSLDEHYRRAYNEHQATYLGSATKDKGMLALTVGMPGAELAAAAQHYFKAHPQRRSQAETLVRALAANGDRPAVQLLLAVSRQFKLRTVRETAGQLAEELAEARGWTADQLADRTVQTAGFDDDGVLRLAFGTREFTGRITDAFTIELRNDKGKIVKSAPSAPQGADDDLRAAYKEARTQFSASKKELKAVAELQTRRLREAMTTGRTWSGAEWREFVAEHPVMSRLAARVIWLSAPGTPAQCAFRLDDGAFVSVTDEDVTLSDDERIAVAHAITLPGGNEGEDTTDAWRQHLADYEVKPLLDQLDAVLPDTSGGATEVTDREGWLSDSFTIRGRLMARGWKRGMAQDAGWYYEYLQEHVAAGLEAEIEFTGSFFGEENIPAATKALRFRKPGTFGDRGVVPLADVPPVLLAEAYADYLDAAAAGTYDPEWERKSEY